jgi:hypothetical protein
VTEAADLSIHFGEPGRYPESLAWPLAFDNDVRPSVRLLRMCLERAGFEDIRELPCPDWLPPEWQGWFRSQKGFLAFRTADVRTALTPGGGKRRRSLPPEAPVKPRHPDGEIRLVKEDLHGFNIVSDGFRYYATLCKEGTFDLARFRRRGYQMQFRGRTLGSVLCRILKAAPTPLKPRHPLGTLRLVLEDVYGFNVISDGLRYYAVRASEGAFDLARFRRRGYRVQFRGRTLGSVICRLLKGIRSADFAGAAGAETALA